MKLTEKELNEFPIGTKIYTNANIFIKTGYSLYAIDNVTDCFYENKEVITFEVEKVEIPTYTEYIPPKPILDDKEKEWFDFLKPFRNRIRSIIKVKNSDEENILIVIKDSINLCFPGFKKGSMYKGMELNREYTLEELGL